MKTHASLALALSLLFAGCAGMTTQATNNTARAELRNASDQVVGNAVLTQVGGVVRVVLDVEGMPPGAKAVHIHDVGKCEGPSFESAGGHFNPESKQHGLQNPLGAHAGDLPNLVVGADGKGRLESTTEMVSLANGTTSLFDGDGSALVVHAAPDDFRTDPTGNAGARAACGVVVKK